MAKMGLIPSSERAPHYREIMKEMGRIKDKRYLKVRKAFLFSYHRKQT